MIRLLRRRRQVADPWDLDRTVLSFSKRDPWSIRQSVAGTLVCGASGAGKTSGPGAMIARSFLEAGYGGLTHVAKADERSERVSEYFDRSVGPAHLIQQSAGSPYTSSAA